MTGEEAIKELREMQECADIESAHGVADNVLCEVLIALGHGEIVKEWRLVKKWYA